MITGNIGVHLQKMNLQAKWQEKSGKIQNSKPKIVTGTKISAAKRESNNYTAAIDRFLKEQDKNGSKIRSFLTGNSGFNRGTVEFKLKYGGKFSAQELAYIRTNCPDLYEEVQKREQERAAYEQQMKNCKSKDEALSIHMGKMASFMSEVHDAVRTGNWGASFEIRARLYEVEEEYGRFLKEEYSKLRWDREIREEEAEKKKAAENQDEKNVEENAEENIEGNQKENLEIATEKDLTETIEEPGREFPAGNTTQPSAEKKPQDTSEPKNEFISRDKPERNSAEKTLKKFPDMPQLEQRVNLAIDKYKYAQKTENTVNVLILA